MPEKKDRGQMAPGSDVKEGADGPQRLVQRNVDWRFSCCYHGDWLIMPLNFLEVVANVCYQFPKPRFIDPAVVYDAVKIRRLVEEATVLAIQASSEVALPKLSSVSRDLASSVIEHNWGAPKGHNTKLSAERRFRMREQAIQKLARAYRLNEMAATIASSKHLVSFNHLTEMVIQRKPEDPDASYVHLFHEKVPFEDTARDIDMVLLNRIISAHPDEPGNWRTSAMVRMMKGDYEAAASDLTFALSICWRYAQGHQSALLNSNVPDEKPRSRVQLPEDEQPSSLRSQLLSLRAWAYLCAASHQVRVALGLAGGSEQDAVSVQASTSARDQSNPHRDDDHKSKRVKSLAKRSLADIMAFLAELDYSPDLAMTTVKEFSERTERMEYGTKRTRHTERSIASQPCKTYKVSELFSVLPPSGLPDFPRPKKGPEDDTPEATCEAVTAHPMLPEVLHELLLCHCLLQTSAKELQRHAYMVARLITLIDISPVFYPSTCPARTDWRELTLRIGRWIHLCGPWDALCMPEPLAGCPQEPLAVSKVKMAHIPTTKGCAQDAPGAVHQGQETGSWGTSHGCIPIQQARKIDPCIPYDGPEDPATEDGKIYEKRPAKDSDSYEFSERAFAIGQWILRAPMVKGTRMRKKKPSQPKATAAKASEDRKTAP
ncbi:hypothetical protein NLU13_2172 [Sarocladium strictum]|uniref:Uncharacterized protein n=1 Tax=Sarocladium strictum TaxID=5046 RepID=A0AA39GSC9_SARSR|nr:hypothetical protein NLU13_2172 [Sarocladium strictum]